MRLKKGLVALAVASMFLIFFLAEKAISGNYWWSLYFTPGGLVPAVEVDFGYGDSVEEVLATCFQRFPDYGCQLLGNRDHQDLLALEKDYQEGDGDGPKCWCETGGPTTARLAN